MMKNFRASSKMRTEVMKILVNLLNEKEIESLKSAFKAMDTDQTGQIKISKLQDAMESAGIS
jgi:calcium-dependent protein kinase